MVFFNKKLVPARCILCEKQRTYAAVQYHSLIKSDYKFYGLYLYYIL